MKLTKRILVVLAAVALLVSSFAFIASAEFTEDNIEDVLEYYNNPRYIKENFNSLELGSAYMLDASGEDFASAKLMTAMAKVVADPKNPNNKVLSYTNIVDGVSYLGYSLVFDDDTTENDMPSELVFTMKLRSDKKYANVAPAFSVNLYACDEDGREVGNNGHITALKLDFETGTVAYSKVNPGDSARFDLAPVSGLKAKSGVWYTVTMIFNCNKGTYNFVLAEDGGSVYESADISFGETEFINEINANFTSLPANNGAVNYMDNVDIYAGTFLRGDVTRDEATAQALYDISELVANNEISLETQLRIAKVYEVIMASDYVPGFTGDFTEKTVVELYEAAKAFIPETYTRAFCESADAIDVSRSYSRRMKQVALIESYISTMNTDETYASAIELLLADVEAGILEETDKVIAELDAEASQEGLEDSVLQEIAEERAEYVALKETVKLLISDYEIGSYETLAESLEETLGRFYEALDYLYEAEEAIIANEASYAKVSEAKTKLSDEKILLERVARESELFIVYMQEYDPECRDYEVIKELASRIEAECVYRNNSYNYTSTPNVYQYDKPYKELLAKKDAIVKNVTEFQNAVDAMYKEDASFSDIYNSYLAASKVYNGGKIHPDVDVTTVSHLEIDIDRYLEMGESLKAVTEICDDFIALSANASAATFYQTMKDSLAAAKKFLADNTDAVIEDYPGVKEARASLTAVENNIKALEASAAKYIAAVNAINPKAKLSAYKTATEAARALASAGNVIGIDGVAEANLKLSAYESEIDSYEGNSKTLTDAVAKLSDDSVKLTLAERRALIIIANNAKDKAHAECAGVTAAREAIEKLTAAYVAEVQAANAAFAGVVNNACASAPSVVNQSKYNEVREVVKALLK